MIGLVHCLSCTIYSHINPFATVHLAECLPTDCSSSASSAATAAATAILICVVREFLPAKYAKFVPSPMALGIPFYIGANSAVDFWMGSLVMHVWEYVNPAGAEAYGPVVGAGLLVGDGIFAIPSSVLAIVQKLPPICMTWFAGGSELLEKIAAK